MQQCFGAYDSMLRMILIRGWIVTAVCHLAVILAVVPSGLTQNPNGAPTGPVSAKQAKKHPDKDLETSYEADAAIARGDNDQARHDLRAANDDYGKAVDLSRPLPDRYCVLKAKALRKL